MNLGQSVTLTSTVAANAGSISPAGSVDFYDTTTSTDLGTVVLAAGIAMLSTANLPLGCETSPPTYGGNNDFQSSRATVTLTVQSNGNGKSDQTISFGPLSDQTYGASPISLDATASSGDPVAFRIVSGPATLAGDVLTVTGTGSVVVEASQAGDSHYNAAPVVDESFTVARAPLTITTQDARRAYGAANPAFAVTYAGFVNSDGPTALGGTLTFSTTASVASNVGQYTVTPAGLTSANYVITFQPGMLTIDPAPLTVTATGVDKVYDGTTSAMVSLSDDRLSGDSLTVSYGSASFADKNVGIGKAVTVVSIAISGPRRGQLHAPEHHRQHDRHDHPGAADGHRHRGQPGL